MNDVYPTEIIQEIEDVLSWYSDSDLWQYLGTQGLQLTEPPKDVSVSAHLRRFLAEYLHSVGWQPGVQEQPGSYGQNDLVGILVQPYSGSVDQLERARFTRLPNSPVTLIGNGVSGALIYPATPDPNMTPARPDVDIEAVSQMIIGAPDQLIALAPALTTKERIDLFEVLLQKMLNDRDNQALFETLFEVVPWLNLPPDENYRVNSFLTQNNFVAALREVRDLSTDQPLYQ